MSIEEFWENTKNQNPERFDSFLIQYDKINEKLPDGEKLDKLSFYLGFISGEECGLITASKIIKG